MAKAKSQPKQEAPLNPVFENLEFTRRADELIGVIQRHFRMIEGRNVESPEILQIATKIVKERLK